MKEETKTLVLTEEEARLVYDRLRTDSGNLRVQAYHEPYAENRRQLHELAANLDRISERARVLHAEFEADRQPLPNADDRRVGDLTQAEFDALPAREHAAVTGLLADIEAGKIHEATSDNDLTPAQLADERGL